MLEYAYSRPQMGFWGKWGKSKKTETFCSFIPLGMQYPGTDALRIKQHKIGCVLSK